MASRCSSHRVAGGRAHSRLVACSRRARRTGAHHAAQMGSLNEPLGLARRVDRPSLQPTASPLHDQEQIVYVTYPVAAELLHRSVFQTHLFQPHPPRRCRTGIGGVNDNQHGINLRKIGVPGRGPCDRPHVAEIHTDLPWL